MLTGDDLRGTDPAELRQLIGDKAADLVMFSWKLADLGAPHTRFQLVPASFQDAFQVGFAAGSTNSGHCRPPRLRYPPLPTVETVAAGFAEWTAPLARHSEALLPQEPVVVRSSLLWPSREAPRAPGVDTTAIRSGPDSRDSPMARVWAGLYKAYTSFWLDRAGCPDPTAPRRAGLILMELVAVRAQGTAYLFDDTAVIEFAPVTGDTVVVDSAARLARLDLLSAGTAADLDVMLRQVAPKPEDAGLTEVEFLISETETIHLLQRRALDRPDTGAPVPVFSSVGNFQGGVLDLRWFPRTAHTAAPLVANLRAAAGRALVVRLKDDAMLDAFGLVWTLASHPDIQPPQAVFATHDNGTQAGMKTHLKWTLRQALPGTLFASVPDRELPFEINSLVVESDGVTTRVLGYQRAPDEAAARFQGQINA